MRNNWKVVYGIPVLCIILAVFWNESWSYSYLSNKWPIHGETEDCDRMLLVADPQLIGYQREKWGWIARWDSDRYLSTGFQFAKNFFNPSAIIFLGDLFDEGLEANEDEWTETYERFINIFPIDHHQNVIYIAGDNDIGGESELISEPRRNKFSHYFRNNVTKLKEKYVIDETYLFEDKNVKNLAQSKLARRTKILLTHVPYLTNAYKYTDVGMRHDLILSAHDHTNAIYEIQRSEPRAVLYSKVYDEFPTYLKTIGENEPLIEIMTPTCSYRMGVPSMGYGALTVCRLSDSYRTTQIQFSVYWLPARFAQLLLYLCTVIFCVGWILYFKCYRMYRRYSWLK